MKRMGLLAGDYVRGEQRCADGSHNTVRKDTPLAQGMVVKISVNRKVTWQHRS